MRKLTQKLVLSVVTMALVVIALGTSTFAWFSLTNSAAVGQFEAQVTAGEGIEVALGTWATNDASVTSSSTWYTVIAVTVIQNRLTEMYSTNLKLVDLTSEDGIVIEDLGGTGVNNLSGRYVEFKLFFRSTAESTIVWNSASLTGTAKAWTVDASFKGANLDTFTGAPTHSVGSTVQVAAWSAARISIFNAAGTLGEVFQAPQATGSTTASVVYNSTALPAVSYATGEEFGAASYQLAKNDGVSIYTLPGAGYGAAVETVTAGVPVVALTKAQPTDQYAFGTVIVGVWIEGWDADAFDAIFATNLFVQLGFGKQ